jgi:hypothetical protein
MDFFIPSVREPMVVVADRVNIEVFSLALAHAGTGGFGWF